jgi:hypothetical protein
MRQKSIQIGILLFLLLGLSQAPAQEKEKIPWDGNRTVPVHNIPLKDEFNEAIIPTESFPLPYSSRYTCAPCHVYSQISQGLHFNAVSSDKDGRPGEPWIWVDRDTGTAIPLSYRNWPGVFHPEELGLTFWEFILLFGRHLTGGGIGEPAVDERSPESRWDVSGTLEINCLACHNNSRKQSHSEWAFQILRQNFRWAAVASSSLGEVGGMASRLSRTWDIYDGPNPDDTEYAIAPYVRYDKTQFNSKHEVFFDLNHKPDDERCLACHSVSPASQSQFLAESDVHTAAGIQCADCHRNDISHAMIRGYEGESEQYGKQSASDFTCRGCHLREKESQKQGVSSGRLGAPYPIHKKIPPIHIEKLSCTACHSGSLPKKHLTRVKTSRANRLGIYGIARWDMDFPAVQEPVFQRDSNGRLAPNRLVWPCFWGCIEGEDIRPLRPDTVKEAAGPILHPESEAAGILSALSIIPDLEAAPVFVSSGRVYELNFDGGLDASEYSGEMPEAQLFWALKKNNFLSPLIPDFDRESDPLDRDIEYRIQDTLEALNNIKKLPYEPALIYGNKVYQISEGYFETKEWNEEAQDSPRLCWLKDNEIKNLVSEFNLNAVKETVGYPELLTEEQAKKILTALSEADISQDSETNKEYVYISSGKIFRINQQGSLEASEHPASEPVLWPLAHQVRPVQQSLGINGCADCHSWDSNFFFADVTASGPLKTKNPVERSAHSFMGLGGLYQKIFGLSFCARPFLKVILFIAALFLGSILIIMFIKTLGFLTGLLEKRR